MSIILDRGLADNGGTASREDPPSGSNIPTSGAEWVELLVSGVFKASNIEDSKARVSHALEALEKSICVNATSETAQSFQRENSILKWAVSIQHKRQKEFEEMGQELHKLKQLVMIFQRWLVGGVYQSLLFLVWLCEVWFNEEQVFSWLLIVESAGVENVIIDSVTEQKDVVPLDKFLPPPPMAKCSDELQMLSEVLTLSS
ncbi:hypothetical protein ACS0TY_024272 [Phlomoides rotata]